jgi:hypothetical protein
MARVSIYVPDDLKVRMDRIGEAANWSEVVRPAILSAVANHEHRKGVSMSTVVERLKASKERYLKETENCGLDAGRRWASNTAEYSELLRVANYWKSSRWEVELGGLRQLIDPDENLSTEKFCELVGCESFEESGEFAEGFARGAAELYDEVEAEIEKEALAAKPAKVTPTTSTQEPFAPTGFKGHLIRYRKFCKGRLDGDGARQLISAKITAVFPDRLIARWDWRRELFSLYQEGQQVSEFVRAGIDHKFAIDEGNRRTETERQMLEHVCWDVTGPFIEIDERTNPPDGGQIG